MSARGGRAKHAPIEPALLLAAVARAQRHDRREQEGEGVLLASVHAHLGLPHHSGTTRRVRPQLETLLEAEMVERWRRHGRPLWRLTERGRRAASPFSALPESPQHRQWSNARTLAEQEHARVRQHLAQELDHAQRMLARTGEDAPSSGDWLAADRRLEAATRAIASVVYCAREWQEPDDAQADRVQPPQSGLRWPSALIRAAGAVSDQPDEEEGRSATTARS